MANKAFFYAVDENNSRGRIYPEPEHSYRDPFQRDRDRIIHSSAFRRLEKKTQVFVVFEGDYYRTRLTHTLEVAQISRTIARELKLNEELAEAIALAHDLGHSPFGHTGERVLHELMEGHGGFEHNRQGLRVVDLLESRYPDFPGLNLVFEVREGIIKHETDYDTPDSVDWEGPAGMPTLEAQIVTNADQITFACHDIDDGLKSGVLTEKMLYDVDICKSAIDGMTHGRLLDSEKMRRYQLIRRLIDTQVTDLINVSLEKIRTSGIETAEDVRKQNEYLVSLGEEMKRATSQLKKFLMENFYRDHHVARMSHRARMMLRKLFDAYLNDLDLLPSDTRTRLGEDTEWRVVCDYVAGMTDSYAYNEYKRLFGVAG